MGPAANIRRGDSQTGDQYWQTLSQAARVSSYVRFIQVDNFG